MRNHKGRYYCRKTIKFIMLSFIVLSLSYSCANMGMPEGGAKDSTPPELIKSEPANFSTRVNQKRFKLYFNEYIVSKDLNKQLIISPPIKEKPEIKFKGKSIQIDFNESLLPNTTYSINFGNAIADNNEGNVLKNFQYVFATGDHLDSLRISGKVISAETGKAAENVLLMLYKNHSDSAPYKELPYYLARSDDKGRFSIKNIADTSYRLFCLLDGNSSFTFDQPGESIGFYKEEIRPSAKVIVRTDTIPGDSIKADSVVVKEQTIFSPDSLEIALFTEDFFKQYLKSKSRIEEDHIQLVFNEKVSGPLTLSSGQPGVNPSNWLIDFNAGHDTLNLWINDSLEFKNDSLYFFMHWPNTKIFNPDSLQTDTLNLHFHATDKNKKSLKATFSPKKNLELSTLPSIVFNRPIQRIDTSQLLLYQRKDSTNELCNFQLQQDSSALRKYILNAEFVPGATYQFITDSAAFLSYPNLTNDSLAYEFFVRNTDYYGQIILEYQLGGFPAIIQLLDAKETVLAEFQIDGSNTLKIPGLKAGTYNLRAIIDENKNNKWDSGNYLKQRQPEKVLNYTDPVKVRANWDIELNWDLREY